MLLGALRRLLDYHDWLLAFLFALRLLCRRVGASRVVLNDFVLCLLYHVVLGTEVLFARYRLAISALDLIELILFLLLQPAPLAPDPLCLLDPLFFLSLQLLWVLFEQAP